MKRTAFFLALLLLSGVARAWTYRAVSWDADWENRRTAGFGSPEAGRQMDEAASMGFNTFVLSPIARQTDVNRPDIRFSRELEFGLAADMNRVINIGLKVVYQPQIWSDKFKDGSDWSGTIEMRSEGHWNLWFKEYTDMAVTHAAIAERVRADIFVVGSGYVKTSSRTADWQGVIKAVREVYKGKVTYAAHNFDEADNIGFWAELDFIGVNAYFPLATGGRIDTVTLGMAWADGARRLEGLAKKTGKPVFVTEVGYASVPGTAAQPGLSWPAGTPVDEDLQARCYEAMFAALRRKPWLAGVNIWKYKIGVAPPETSREPSEWYFTFQEKKAESVIRRNLKGAGR